MFYNLVKLSDVVIETSAPEFSSLQVDYETLNQINPRIIQCSVTGFGMAGPFKDYPALDLSIQAFAGHMAVTASQGVRRRALEFPGRLERRHLCRPGRAGGAFRPGTHRPGTPNRHLHVRRHAAFTQLTWARCGSPMVNYPNRPARLTTIRFHGRRLRQRWVLRGGRARAGRVATALRSPGGTRTCRRPTIRHWLRIACRTEPSSCRTSKASSAPARWRMARTLAGSGRVGRAGQPFRQGICRAASRRARNDRRVRSSRRRQGAVPGNPIKISGMAGTISNPAPGSENTDVVLSQVLSLSADEIEALRRQGAIG